VVARVAYVISIVQSVAQEAKNSWWTTILTHPLLLGVAPHYSDESILPFLQMAQAETVQVGCSVQLCEPPNTTSYYSVACYYDIPHVEARVPLYTVGEPCNQCRQGFKCDDATKLCILK
ncbi:hypothetical protein DICVIV_11759, partial [Dictyocaulus viviparus]